LNLPSGPRLRDFLSLSSFSRPEKGFTTGKNCLYFGKDIEVEPLNQEFSILGQKIVIPDPAEAGTAREAFELVNAKIEELRSKKPLLGPAQLSVLALLELAGSMARDRRAFEAYRGELDRRVEKLMEELTRLSGT
jgi:cell division protein ZapA (FtsZ GTPase activity inhibitor)